MFKVGDRVTVKVGLESRFEGVVEKGPYVDAEQSKYQRREFGVIAKTFYDVRVEGIGLVTNAATFVRRPR